MSRLQVDKTETVENSHLISVKVNDVLIDEADTGKLELAKQRISQVFHEIESELIHRSQDNAQDEDISKSKEDVSLIKSSNEEFIKIILKSNNTPTVTVDSLVSPAFIKLLNENNLLVFQALIKFLTKLPDAELLKVVSAIIPALIFAASTLLLIYYSGRVNGWVVLGSIIAGLVSLFLSVKLFRFFSEVRRYIAQEKIIKDHLTQNR